MLAALVQQATAHLAVPQQLVSAQVWPTALAEAVLHAHSTADMADKTAGMTGTATGPRIPALHHWLTLHGSITGQDGTRPLRLTLQVPAAWAQAQAKWAGPGADPRLPTSVANLGPAGSITTPGPTIAGLTGLAGAGTLHLTVGGSVQQLSSLTLGVVMQAARPDAAAPHTPAAAAQRAQEQQRVSAILQIEMQSSQPPSATQIAQTAAAHLPAHMLSPDIQAALQGRQLDPWLLLAQYYASQQNPRQQPHAGEQPGLCVIAGCQYEGRAVCAQPFCAEMNYLWSVARAQPRA